MLLSICIPTYNRGPILVALVRSLFQMMPETLKGRIEVVISENHSSDLTRALLQEAFGDLPEVRICLPEQHLATAEENLCFAISQCRGEFVWSLGDDDAIESDSFATLAQILEANTHDYMIFNSRSVSYEGVLKNPVQVKCDAPRLDMPMLDFVRLSGFWFILAGFSMSVFRRSLADTKMFQLILSTGRIYAHVIWLISCFHDKRFCFINQPLVAYRENSYVTVKTDHWDAVSRRENTFDGGLWSTGFLRLVDILADRGIFDRRFVAEVVDQNPHHRFYFADELLVNFLRGLTADINQTGVEISKADLSYFNEWALVLWGNNIVLLSILDEMLALRSASKPIDPKLVQDLRHILDMRKLQPWFEAFHKYDAYGFAVFYHGGRWFALRRGYFTAVMPMLETLDFNSHENLVGVRLSESDLLEWIKSQPRHLKDQPAMAVERYQAQRIDSHYISANVRANQSWTLRDWYRIVRALNHVAKRSIKRKLGL